MAITAESMLRKSSLDEVFLPLTGHHAKENLTGDRQEVLV